MLDPHSISFVCVFHSKIKMLFNWPCSAPIKHAKLHLPTATSMHWGHFFFFWEEHWGHLDTYICYHITLTFSILFIQLTTITTTNSTCNTPSKKNRPCNICNVAEPFDSTYEISHLMLQYIGYQHFQYMERLTQDKVCVLSHICWEHRKYTCLFHGQQLTEKLSTDFLKNHFHMCKTENFCLTQINKQLNK